MDDDDWDAGFARSVGLFLNGDTIAERDPRGQRVSDDSFLVILNAHDEPLDWTLPVQWCDNWEIVIDSSAELTPGDQPDLEKPLAIHGRAVVVLTSAWSSGSRSEPRVSTPTSITSSAPDPARSRPYRSRGGSPRAGAFSPWSRNARSRDRVIEVAVESPSTSTSTAACSIRHRYPRRSTGSRQWPIGRRNGRECSPTMPERTQAALRQPRVVISDVRPHVDCGRYHPKRVVGDAVEVSAIAVTDGHEQVRAELAFRLRGSRSWKRVPMLPSRDDVDRFTATFPADRCGEWEFTVSAWIDAAATWRDELRRKVEAGQVDLAAELAEGSELLDSPIPDAEHGLATTAGVVTSKVSMPRPLAVVVEPVVASFSAWYELFPRSFGGFDGVRKILPEIADLGFDVVYLPPIHPIGTTNRKGRNNTLVAMPDDPGSPWAIGGPDGGHKAVHRELGTLASFDRLVGRARELGLEIALDFALQCSPDHPWLTKHPEWFAWRPDGSIKYAENPPKRYQDIVNFRFDGPKAKQLWEALLGVVEHWIAHGVRIFRVDNPHTKPFAFWEWLITSVHREHPDIVFLAEAFTRPAVMHTLAKLGFSQSYTYFTWRNSAAELAEYVTELSTQADWFRPNFFVNTPDILHEYLQRGGRPAFEARTVLASTLSPSWGMYSGFERLERTPAAPGSEEYLDSEKYACRTGEVGGPISPLVRRCNEIRRSSPVFRRVDNVRFVDTANEQILGYVKGTGRDAIVVCVNLDPFAFAEGLVDVSQAVDAPEFPVIDMLSGAEYTWRAGGNYVRLPPGGAHILAVR